MKSKCISLNIYNNTIIDEINMIHLNKCYDYINHYSIKYIAVIINEHLKCDNHV